MILQIVRGPIQSKLLSADVVLVLHVPARLEVGCFAIVIRFVRSEYKVDSCDSNGAAEVDPGTIGLLGHGGYQVVVGIGRIGALRRHSLVWIGWLDQYGWRYG